MNANTFRAECVARACGYLNDAGLPNVQTLAESLASLVSLVRALDANMLGCEGLAADVRVSRAASQLDNLAPHLTARIDWEG
jgi:hypothetical protein